MTEKETGSPETLGLEILLSVRNPDDSDTALLAKVQELIEQGARLDVLEERTMEPSGLNRDFSYSAYDWAAANDYEGTLLTMAEALVASENIGNHVKKELLAGAIKYLPFESITARDQLQGKLNAVVAQIERPSGPSPFGSL